jgi:hypothetical protein
MIGLVLLRVALLVMLYSSFKQLPSPVYGGDLYHQLGAINHVKYGGNPFSAFATLEGGPTYFPMYSLLVGGAARLFGMEAETAMYFCSYVLTALGMVLVYLLGIKLFKNPTLGLGLMLIYFGDPRGILKYTELARFVVYPLLFLCFLNYLKFRKLKWTLLTGFMLGLAALSHGMGMLLLWPILLLCFLFEAVVKHLKKGKLNLTKLRKALPGLAKDYGIILGMGLVLSLPYWQHAFKAMFSGIPMGDVTIYVFTLANMLPVALKKLFSFSGLLSGLVTVLFWLGIVLVFFLKKQKQEIKLMFWFAILLILAPFHFVVSEPLFGFSAIPNHMMSHAYAIAIALLAGLALMLINNGLPNGEKIALGVVGVLIFANALYIQGITNNDRWIEAGRQPLPPYLLDAAAWIRQNTDVNDVFLTTKEVGSALNALTGRKFVALKESHVSLFMDSFQREKHAALMLYGNNDTVRAQLLEEYSVDYLYWDVYWFRSEFIINSEGQVTAFFDPITVPWELDTVGLFDLNGVEYVEQNMAIDPSKRDGNPMVRTHEVLVVLPSNWDLEHPWHASLDPFLGSVVEFSQQNQLAARIFELTG